MVSIFMAQALQGKKVHVKGSLDRFRDFIEISDVVEAFALAATTDKMDGKVLNLGTGQRTSVKDLLEGLKTEIPEMSWYTEGSTPGDQIGLYADTGRLKEVLKFEAKVNINSGLAKFTKWARKQTDR
jgi:UDP-glucose 4-epimerase